MTMVACLAAAAAAAAGCSDIARPTGDAAPPPAPPRVTPTVAAQPPPAATPSSPSPSASQSPDVAKGDFEGLVDIGGGRKIYLECKGQGSPTVVLESGYRDSRQPWSTTDHPPTVMRGVAQFTRVCSYDRPGTISQQPPPPHLGPSSEVPMPRTAQDVAGDLHTLLTTAHVPGPYVLVGHSMGGPFDQLYAATYPGDVKGLVLVDAFSTTLRKRLGGQWPTYLKLVNQPPAPAFKADPHLELINEDASIDQVEAALPLPRMPLVVVSKGRPFQLPASLPKGITGADVERVWPQAQDDLLKLESDAEHVIAKDSDHYIQVEQPDLVIKAIRDVVARARGR